MKIHRVSIASGLISSVLALAANDPSQVPSIASKPVSNANDIVVPQEPFDEKLANAIKEQKKRLEELNILSKNSPKKASEEINEKLRELSIFYNREYPYAYYPTGHINPTQTERGTLILSAKNEFQAILQNLLNSLSKGSIEERNLAFKNIQAFNSSFPWYDIKATHLIGENTLLEKYFDAHYKDSVTNIDEAIFKLETGSKLLYTAIHQDEDSNCSRTFCLWLEKMSNSEAVQGLSKEDAKNLHTKVMSTSFELIRSPYSYLTHGPKSKYSTALELTIPLIKATFNIVKQNTGDTELLSEALRTITQVKSFVNSVNHYTRSFPEERKKVNNALSPLFDATFQAIFNLPQGEERTKLVTQIFNHLSGYYINSNSSNTQQAQIVDPLNKYLFSKDKKNTDDFNLFMKCIFARTYPQSNSIGCSPYVFFQLVNDHPEYFLVDVKRNIDDASLDTLAKYFHLFNILHRLNVTGMVDANTREKVLTWSRQNIEEPIFQIAMEGLNKQRVQVEDVKTHARQERYVRADKWREFNKMIDTFMVYDPYFAGKLTDVIKDRIKNSNNSYERQMLVEMLATPLEHEQDGHGNYSVLNLLLERVCYEDMPHVMETIGNLIADGIKYEHKNIIYNVVLEEYSDEGQDMGPGPHDFSENQQLVAKYVEYEHFFNKLNEYSRGNITLDELRKKGDLPFTKIQKFILDLVGISEGDTNKIKQLTAIELNPPIFWRTYRNRNTGEEVTVEITGSGTEEQKALDRQYSKDSSTYEFLGERTDRSKQNPRDFTILMQARRNSRAALAYIGAKLIDFNLVKRDNVVLPRQPYQIGRSEITRLDEIFRKAMVNILGRQIGWYSTASYLGYEVGPYIDLCTVAESEAGKLVTLNNNPFQMNGPEEDERGKAQRVEQAMKDLIAVKLQGLRQQLFDSDNARLKWPKTFKDQKLAELTFAKQVMDSAPSGQRMYFLRFLIKFFNFSAREVIDIDDEIKNTRELLRD